MSDCGESDVDRLSALLIRQAEMAAQQAALSAQREERLAGMLERLMSREPPPGAVTDPPNPAADAEPIAETGARQGAASGAEPGVEQGVALGAADQAGSAAAAGRSAVRMPASATPAPHLTSSASIRDLTV